MMQPDDNRFMLTTSYDQTAVLWSTLTFTRVATLVGHSSLVMRASFTPDGSRIVTAGHDRTWKLWDYTGDVKQGEEEETERLDAREKLYLAAEAAEKDRAERARRYAEEAEEEDEGVMGEELAPGEGEEEMERIKQRREDEEDEDDEDDDDDNDDDAYADMAELEKV